MFSNDAIVLGTTSAATLHFILGSRASDRKSAEVCPATTCEEGVIIARSDRDEL